MLAASTLDIATDPESIELPIPDERRTPLPKTDPPLSPINERDPTKDLPEPEAKLNHPPLRVVEILLLTD